MIDAATRILIEAASAAIKADAGVAAAFAGKPVRMLQIVPEFGADRPPAYPFVTFGGAEKKRLPDDCGAPRATVLLHLHIWDSDKTITRVTNIAESIEAPLLALALDPADGLKLQARTHVLTRSHYDQDRALLFGLCQIEYRVAGAAGA